MATSFVTRDLFAFQSLVRDRALEIIENHDSSDPLFLMYSDPLPHTPLQVNKHYGDIIMGTMASQTTSLTIEPVSAFSQANNPGRANENPIWWRWHGNTKSHAILPSADV